MDSYRTSYPLAKTEKCRVIENGYDEEIFDQALRTYSEPKSTKYKAINIVHSGILYPDHRDPNPLFRAIKELKENWRTRNLTVTFSLRGAGYDDYYHELINSYGICEEVKLLSSIDYVSSVRELLGSDGLLLMQGASCNAQIPAKIYEYFRVGKPILALVDSTGATAKTLSRAGISSVNFENNTEQLKQYIGEFCDAILNGTAERFTYTGDTETISRSYRSEQLRTLVEEVAYN